MSLKDTSCVYYAEEDIVSKTSGFHIHTYCWIPNTMLDYLQENNASSAQPKASVFLIHGLHSNTFCEYLEPDPSQNGARRLYSNSIPQLLNEHGFVVFAHDHQGHGKSQGKCKGYFDSMETLVSDTLQLIEWITKEKYPVLKEKPIFLMGCSMGSLVSILLGLKYGSYLRGAVLISPAVSQANNQFGVIGRILKPLSGWVSAWYPTLPVLRLPKNEKFPQLQKSWDNDELNYHGKLRARVGEQFVKTYDELSEKATNFTIPFIMYYGSEDTLVDPKGMQSFFDKAASRDKKVVPLEGRWHILHHEPGKELVREQFLQWIEERC
ncbi:hypothetical protein GpartN1_g5281.t1 [Galdieria partita]|uniref:Serine aminopeptidase S33 domain-containing protein n=1 Tax=Galdieria partita TaxID=83374 RepID=A0A9C7PZW7_9RHOD|nr:hypothetical protein GpartN1_g5281.t1 [Galdieria partita]